MSNKDLISKDDFKLLICHRMPERTFKINNYYFPVCARCTGFYISMFFYFVFVYFFYVNYTVNLIFIAILMLIPAILDGFSQFIGFRESNNYLRFVTGLISGLGLAIIFKGIKFFIFINIL